MTMPDMTGVDLAKRILTIRPNFPIVLCTGYSELMKAEPVLKTGIQDWIMKPVTKKDLAVTIRKILDSTHTDSYK
jgi:YesN/AraC family two-component response regulator